MRLLDTSTLELRTFYSSIPLYAILSHTWTDEDVTFEEIGTADAEKKLGFQKIKRCCSQAASDGFRFIWIDSCCIDKRSSTELSEAINSMYGWYESAQVCYAYLSDVHQTKGHDHPQSEFARSRWFTRGWTLQELVAPADIVFFGAHWVEIGTKASLGDAISQITKIDVNVLKCSQNVFKASVAQRMSWDSDRHTTRVEDIAYCLNAGSSLGRILPNFAADYVGTLNMQLTFAFASAVLSLSLIAIRNVHGILGFCVLYGFFTGTFVSLPAPTVASLTLNMASLGGRMSMAFMTAGVGSLIGSPIAGAILSTNGGNNWNMLQVWSGVLLVLSSLSMLGARTAKVGAKLNVKA